MQGVVAEGLVKRFGDFTALDGVDFAVEEGMLAGLLGPNGAGKTTAIRILTTLLTFDGGRATVGGFDVVKEAQLVRAVIGLTGQFAAVDDDLTGRENLVLVGRLGRMTRKAAKERAARLLNVFELDYAADRALKTYSGGMRRRLDLGASLMVAPTILFLDEPTTGLDPRSRMSLWDVIAELKREGTTIVLTTQYMEEADRLADRISVIDAGNIIAEGTADELKAMIGGDVIEIEVEDRSMLGATVVAMARAFDLGEHNLTVDRELGTVVVPISAGAPALTQALRALDAEHVPIIDVSIRRPSLDDVFLNLTGHHADDEIREEQPEPRPLNKKARHMTAVSTPLGTSTAHKRATITPSRLAMDVWLLAERNLLKIWRRPRLIVFSIVQPIMQLILFAFVFGAIANLGDTGLTYKDFVVPAVLVQTMVFAGIQSGIGIADDMNTGMIDRFRSLPVARSGFLLGRTVSDGIRLSLQATMVTITAFVIGFHTHNGVHGAVAMVIVAILFGIALVTFSEYMGLAIKDPETVQAAVFIPLLPLIFTSSAFAPVSRLPGWMQPIARVNPVTSAIDTARGLVLGDDALYKVSQVHLTNAAIRFGIAWVVIMVLFTFLAVRQYRKA